MSQIRPQDTVERALALARPGGDCVVIADETSTANLRWAGNTLTTNGVAASRSLTVISIDRRVEGTAGVGIVSRSGVGPDQVENLATIWPQATGASIKDAVNEALVIAIRDGRDTVSYADLIKAKSLKENGLPDGGTYVDRERHSIALHEACHAVVMYRLQHSSVIDTATIERRGDVGGFVAPVPLEEQMFKWRTDVEVDVMTFLASLAGERMFYDGDNTSGVGGDMKAATSLVSARARGRARRTGMPELYSGWPASFGRRS